MEFEFGTGAIVFVNAIVAVMMLGVGVELDLPEFRRTLRSPVGPAVGLVAQFLLLPAVAFAFVQVVDPAPAIALGVILVSACPGGSTSNVITHLAGANASLSIAMTGVSTFLALAMTPLNIAFWGSRVEGLSAEGVSIDPLGLLATLVLVLGLPVATGIAVQVRRPALAVQLARPLRVVAVVGLVVLVVGAVAANLSNIGASFRAVLPVVIAMNVIALALGYGAAAALRLPVRDRRAVSIEVGVQNTALGLTIALAFFPDFVEAALVAALWGMWHMIAGLGLARWWSGRSLIRPATSAPREDPT